MKCEPSIFSISDLEREGEYFWDGVRNYQVRNMFRDEMQEGDCAIFYHSSCAEVGAVGEMVIVKKPKPDPTQFDPKSPYYDSKATKDNPRWLGPTVKFKSKFKRLVTLNEIKLNSVFDSLPLVKRGNRLSCFPITQDHYKTIVRLGK